MTFWLCGITSFDLKYKTIKLLLSVNFNLRLEEIQIKIRNIALWGDTNCHGSVDYRFPYQFSLAPL